MRKIPTMATLTKPLTQILTLTWTPTWELQLSVGYAYIALDTLHANF